MVLGEKNGYTSVKTALSMLLMRTTKTAVCLQTKAILYVGVLAQFHE